MTETETDPSLFDYEVFELIGSRFGLGLGHGIGLARDSAQTIAVNTMREGLMY